VILEYRSPPSNAVAPERSTRTGTAWKWPAAQSGLQSFSCWKPVALACCWPQFVQESPVRTLLSSAHASVNVPGLTSGLPRQSVTLVGEAAPWLGCADADPARNAPVAAAAAVVAANAARVAFLMSIPYRIGGLLVLAGIRLEPAGVEFADAR
jgi:hypothetical protein